MLQFEPFRKHICPFCSKAFHLSECDIVSTVTTEKVLRKPSQGFSKTLERFFPVHLNSPGYIKELACRQCPHCKELLPYNFGFVDNLTIAVVGDTFSGKSHYIAALIHQIREELQTQGSNRYIRFECLN